MTDAATLVITDPTEAPSYPDGLISHWARRILRDPRDEVFVRLSLRMIGTMSALMMALYATLRWTAVPVWIAGAAYLALWGWLAPPVILMLHCCMHRPFIANPKWLGRAHPYVMSFFFGLPAGYREHHVGMHHAEDNMEDDLSSTIRYKRDSFLHFLVYFLRFFFLSIIELPIYLMRRGRSRMARRAVVGELVHYAVIIGAIAFDRPFGVIAFLIPFVMCRFMMMAGNWGQHAFVNTGRKNDGISNTSSCINSSYNRRAFNDGYHIGHHMKASRHWTELPGDFLANRERYLREGALVFHGIDFFPISVLLWTGRWDVLAKRFVRLDGDTRNDQEIIEMLKARVLPVREWPAMAIGRATDSPPETGPTARTRGTRATP